MSKIRIKTRRPWVGYPGSSMQNNFGEDLKHGFLLWDIETRNNFDVKFCELPNPKPFVTIDWSDDIEIVVATALKYPKGSRFRIRSTSNLMQKEVQSIIFILKQKCEASEVVFKSDAQINRNSIVSGNSTYEHADLRSSDVLLKLLKEHVGDTVVDETTSELIKQQLDSYLSLVSEDDVIRNTKWTIKNLEFDNMFTYGEKNVINFDKLNGIVGIFGPNRVGKSSIVGTILYSLFNTTDRGSLKNLVACNERKQYCSSKVLLNVSGVDYIIERQTTKNENKKGQINASTALNVFRIRNGEVVDLCGEQRTDTEKVVRSIIGNVDDFLLTSVATQGFINQFISHGSTKRRQILSRFLDLDVFDKMYDQANKDGNMIRAQLRNYPHKDWEVEIPTREKFLNDTQAKLVIATNKSQEQQSWLDDLRSKLQQFAEYTPVTNDDVIKQRAKVSNTSLQISNIKEKLKFLNNEIHVAQDKIKTVDDIKVDYDIKDLKQRMDSYKALENSVIVLRHSHEKELTLLKHQEKSLKILDEVPCGDKFSSCKFIKDAHVNKGLSVEQHAKTKFVSGKLIEAQDALDILKKEDVSDKLKKVEKLIDLHTKLSVDVSRTHVEIVKHQTQFNSMEMVFTAETLRLKEFEEALIKSENAEVVSLRSKIDETNQLLKLLDREKFDLAIQQGKISSDLEKLIEQKKQRDELLQELNVFELISRAFSKKGIPSNIIKTQLPIINAELAKILHGIADFTIELENDELSDAMEVYINYGDTRRIIELASGMEKTICSLAVRTALINVSSLPKTDFLILDESFDALDENGIEACNRLLVSLKKYFKALILISHLDGIKENVDDVIEIIKEEKDAKITFV